MDRTSITAEELKRRIVREMMDLFELKSEERLSSSDLRKELGLDSIDLVDLAARMEDIAGRKVPLDLLAQANTLEQIVSLATKLLSAK